MNEEEEARIRKDAALRQRKWRQRQQLRLGGLVRLVVWVRREHESALKGLFEKLADPDWIGEAYRSAAAPWLSRNRSPARVFEGIKTRSEVDRPYLNGRFGILPIGGRVFGTEDTMVELTPFEAAELNERIRKALEEVHMTFIQDYDLQDRIRDTTGVIVQEEAPYLNGTKGRVREYDVDRPVGDAQFWANERAIARQVMFPAKEVPEALGNGCFVYGYDGLHLFPSRCLVVTSLAHPEFQTSPDRPLVALVKIENSGTPPTVRFEHLATELRRALLAEAPADAVVWYDAARGTLSATGALMIIRVKLELHDGEYSDPLWMPDEPRNQAFSRFIRETLMEYEKNMADYAALASL